MTTTRSLSATTPGLYPQRGKQAAVVAGLCLLSGLSGCITVKAPDKPIVIELNVNIKQEVVYRLAGDAAQTIDKNAEIF